jgi:hypothetical protein
MVSGRVKHFVVVDGDVTRSGVGADDAEAEAKRGLEDHMAGVGGQRSRTTCPTLIQYCSVGGRWQRLAEAEPSVLRTGCITIRSAAARCTCRTYPYAVLFREYHRLSAQGLKASSRHQGWII